MSDMNEIITRLLNWCHEHDYEILIYTNLTDKSFPHVMVTLSRNGYNAQHIFCLNGLSENENIYPSDIWFDRNLDHELRSFLEFAEDCFSEHEGEVKNDGEM